MKANITNLEDQLEDVLKALERGEDITVLYQGEVKGTLQATIQNTVSTLEHPFFGSVEGSVNSGQSADVSEVMDKLRRPRHSI